VKRFGGLTAVNKINFNIRTGRLYSIIGPNGAGKTTFFNAISGLYPPEEGTITLTGIESTGFRPKRSRPCTCTKPSRTSAYSEG
jgi:branched-chain amino acid transport system ATP-binding protein